MAYYICLAQLCIAFQGYFMGVDKLSTPFSTGGGHEDKGVEKVDNSRGDGDNQ